MEKITASQYVKSNGLPSVAYVARKINKHPQRLFEWFHNNKDHFEAVVAGVKAKEEKQRVRDDMLKFGVGFMKDGKRIDPADVYIEERKG